MKSHVRFVSLLAATLATIGCVGAGAQTPPAPVQAPQSSRVPDVPPRATSTTRSIGAAPAPGDQSDYDEVGYAGRTEAEADGAVATAAIEESGIAAAHRSLPLQSFVEVTRLDTGRTILIRVVERGPADPRRLIALSSAALAQLGVDHTGAFPVRVRRTNPVESERIVLRERQSVPARVDTPESLLDILRERAARLPAPANMARPVASGPAAAPPPGTSALSTAPPVRGQAPAAATPVARSASRAGGYVVQIGAYGSRERAYAVARQTGAVVIPSGRLFRVRFAPVASRTEAETGVARARRFGYTGAIIVRER